MNYTEIRRLFQNNQEFVPITLAEAVVVNTTNIPVLNNIGITTLDKVLKNTLGLVGQNIQDIKTVGDSVFDLAEAVGQVNIALQNKQDKLTAGVGISIALDDYNNTVISATHTLDIYRIVTQDQWDEIKLEPKQDHENIVYLVPYENALNGNLFKEYLCVFKDTAFVWEELGYIQTEVDLSGYVTNQDFQNLVNNVNNLRVTGVTAQQVTTSNGQNVVVNYTIPAELYDNAVSIDENDQIVDPNQITEPENDNSGE